MVTNDISDMDSGQIYYSPMCYPDGGVVDDLLIYKYDNEKFLLVVNASNTQKDIEWLQSHLFGKTELKDVSDDYALLALQGPAAQKILQKITKKNLNEIKFFYFCDNVNIEGIPAFISRNGYTGEDGFEILVSSGDAPILWDKIMTAGKDEGLVPAGLGARDTLRFEVCLPLYGNEIDKDITPLEAGLGFFVKLNKDDFIGKEALAAQRSEGLKRKLCALEMIERGIPRTGYEVFSEDEKIGHITTGSYSPTLNMNIGLALLNIEFSEVGTIVEVAVRKKRVKAKVVKKPFYEKRYKK